MTWKDKDELYWSDEYAAWLEDVVWPATKEELLDYINRTEAPIIVTKLLEQLDPENSDRAYRSMSEIWNDYDPDANLWSCQDDYDGDYYQP
jgi:hypothetical protein